MTSQSPGDSQEVTPSSQTGDPFNSNSSTVHHNMDQHSQHHMWSPPVPQGTQGQFVSQAEYANPSGEQVVAPHPASMQQPQMFPDQMLGMVPGAMMHGNQQHPGGLPMNMMNPGQGQGMPPISSPLGMNGLVYLQGQHPRMEMSRDHISPNATPGMLPTSMCSVSPPPGAGLDQYALAAMGMYHMPPHNRFPPHMIPQEHHKPTIEDQVLYKQHALAMATGAFHHGGDGGPGLSMEERMSGGMNPMGFGHHMAVSAGQSQHYPYMATVAAAGMMNPNAQNPHMNVPPYHAMPPRPRPEGGQDASPTLLHVDGGNAADKHDEQLVINSWNDVIASSVSLGQDAELAAPGINMGMHQSRMPFVPMQQAHKDETGWGLRPPGPNGWGSKPPIGNWQQPPPGPKPVSGPPDEPSDHMQEKLDGRKSAIAETMAMMNKMKLEDIERKELASKQRAARKAAFDHLRESGSADIDDTRRPDEASATYVSCGVSPGVGEARRTFNNHNIPAGGQYQQAQQMGNHARHPMAMSDGPVPMHPNQMIFQPPPSAIPPFPGIDGFQHQHQVPASSGSNNFMQGGFPGSYPQPVGFFQQMGFPPQLPPTLPPGMRGFPIPSQRFPPVLGQRPIMLVPRGRGNVFSQRGSAPCLSELNEDCNNNFNRCETDPSSLVSSDTVANDEKESNVVSVSESVEGDQQDEKGGGAATDVSDPMTQASKNLNSGQGNLSGQLALFAMESSQRERLVLQLVDQTLECLVCLEKITHSNSTWDCKQCFVVFHFTCLVRWAKKNKSDGEDWRCPGCQFMSYDVPRVSLCFCRKLRQPPIWNRRDIPHSCGDVCNVKRRECRHRCTILCHPGPCPPCQAFTKTSCLCGKQIEPKKCGTPFKCDSICGKSLNCKIHQCSSECHIGPCSHCNESLIQSCPCSSSITRIVTCGSVEPTEYYLCGEICGLFLDCGIHSCNSKCHIGHCEPCELTPSKVVSCPCGKEPIIDGGGRTLCSDPVNTCGKTCGASLSCGATQNHHVCKELCHQGRCNTCPLNSETRCRCRFTLLSIPCADLEVTADHPEGSLDRSRLSCGKKCVRKRSCGKHKCPDLCCDDHDHLCFLICNKFLSCGLHRCSDFCHKQKCSVCPSVSFDDLTCHCGSSVYLPPIACGQEPPVCELPCIRPQTCTTHQNPHNCHPDRISCPPCTVLSENWCFGGHQKNKNIPCHIGPISCGTYCRKPLPCGNHTCLLICHKGICGSETSSENPKCIQMCSRLRDVCGHPCGRPCHSGECPVTVCRQKISLYCACKNVSSVVACHDSRSSSASDNHWKLRQQDSDIICALPGQPRVLDCTESCALVERNRRIALALQIENPELSGSAASKFFIPHYSNFLKDFAAKQNTFASRVYKSLVDVVTLARQRRTSLEYSFEVMNREKRHFVHELSDHFGCKSISCDEEPNRSVNVTANHSASWIPSQSVAEVLLKRGGALKGPTMVTEVDKLKPKLTPLNCSNSVAGHSSSSAKSIQSDSFVGCIDYFEYDG